MKQTDYTIAIGASDVNVLEAAERLQSTVRGLLVQGWQAVGSVSVNDKDGVISLHQALVKYNE